MIRMSSFICFIFIGMLLAGIVGSFVNIGLTEVQQFSFICGGSISLGLYLIAWTLSRK